jgi:hypothetical protein
VRDPLRVQLRIDEYENETVLVIDLDDSTVVDWCMSLCLMKEGLVPSFTVTSTDGTFHLTVQSQAAGEQSTRGLVRRTTRGAEIAIDQFELAYWLHFFLKYYRDGIGDVDHIDVDLAPSPSHTSRGFTLVLKVPRALPPGSPEELRRRLGL